MNYDNPVSVRCVRLAEYMVHERATVRGAAAHFGIGKSTVHKDLTGRLPEINHALWLEVKELLECNKAERHIRGGEATREKYLTEKLTSGSAQAK